MRIDDIDLVGPFYINGTIGTEGQILGFSGSQTHWITASGSGGPGGPGPLGPTGGSTGFFLKNENSGAFIFQTPTGLSFSNNLLCYHIGDNLIHEFNSTINSSNLSAIIATDQSTAYNIRCSTIIASKAPVTRCGRFGTHIGGTNNQIGYITYQYSYRTAILGGFNNCIVGLNSNVNDNVIGGGQVSYLFLSCWISTFGGSYNKIVNSMFSTIVGGRSNVICAYQPQDKNQRVSIIGACNSGISPGLLLGNYYHKNSAILGGSGTALVISNGNVCNSVIIGGSGTSSSFSSLDHYLSHNNSVIVGGKDIKVPSILYFGRPSFFNDAAFLNYAVITNNMKLNDYTTTVGLTGFGGTHSRANVVLNQKQSGFSNYISFWGSSGVRQRFRICT
jgi:hypothetical protein